MFGELSKHQPSFICMDTLPQEINLSIFSFLDYKTVFKCREVSQKWKTVIGNDMLWQQFFLQYFGIQPKPHEFTWFEFFKQTMA